MADQIENTVYYGLYFPTRAYGTRDMSAMLEGFYSDGVVKEYGYTLLGGFDIEIDIGIAKALNVISRLFTGEVVEFTVDTSDPTFDRIDSIFYRVDISTVKRDMIVYRPGVASASPVIPSKDVSSPTSIKEIRLFDIYVTANDAGLVPGDIDELAQEKSLPLVAEERFKTIDNFGASPKLITTSTSSGSATDLEVDTTGKTEVEISFADLAGSPPIKYVFDISELSETFPVVLKWDALSSGIAIDYHAIRLIKSGTSLKAYYARYVYWTGNSVDSAVNGTGTGYVHRVKAR